MGIDWAHGAATGLAAFLASLVEFVEALTVILAVGAVRGWRGALGGTGMALALLAVLVAILGPAVTRIPQDAVRLGLGVLLLLFGTRWLRKAILRAAGVIPLHDEEAAYATQSAALRALGAAGRGRAPGWAGNWAGNWARNWDGVAVGTAFEITMVEGIEVVFIVIAAGGGDRGSLVPAGVGALAALVLVALLGLALHRPVAAIPENALKFVVGVLLCAFGTFWAGEGMGLAWPGGDWSLAALNVGFGGAALALVGPCRARAARAAEPQGSRT